MLVSFNLSRRIPGRIESVGQHRVGSIKTAQIVCLAIYIQFAIFIRLCMMDKVQVYAQKHNALDATYT